MCMYDFHPSLLSKKNGSVQGMKSGEDAQEAAGYMVLEPAEFKTGEKSIRELGLKMKQ